MEKNGYLMTCRNNKPLKTIFTFQSKEDRSKYCTHIIVSENRYFIYGLSTILDNTNELSSGPFYFIDFSSNRFTYYLNYNWMYDYPENSKLVIYTDRNMRALANYWFYHALPHVTIYAVIFNNAKSLIDVFSKNKVFPQKGALRLTDYEYDILRNICDGISIKTLSLMRGKSPRTIYSIKNRIEAKLATDIRKLLIT